MIYVIGIGDNGLSGLDPAAKTMLETAELIIGGERHLSFIPNLSSPKIPWQGLEETVKLVLENQDKRICILTSGDPMWFGFGSTLALRLPPGSLQVVPHVSSFSLAAAYLNWRLQDVICASAHGRPLEALCLHFAPRAKLLVLAENTETPIKLKSLLDQQGYGKSKITCLEHLGGEKQKIGETPTSALHVIAIECECETRPALTTKTALPDNAFIHDGQLTKQEVRSATLAALAPFPGGILWDIGAGSGAIGIEWLRAGGKAIAFENNPARIKNITQNALNLGTPALRVIQGEAPTILLEHHETPDAIFIGGGASIPGMLETALRFLPLGGNLVANAVTIEAESKILEFQQIHGGELSRITVSRLQKTGRFNSWHNLAPVTIYSLKKTQAHFRPTKLYGVGVGPGEAKLITQKGAEILKSAAVIAYPANQEGESLALRIAASHLHSGQIRIPINMNFSPAQTPELPAYAKAAEEIQAYLNKGLDVAVLCEGDPLFYGSFIYMLEHFKNSNIEIIPGIASPLAAASLAQIPLALQDEILSIVPGLGDKDNIEAKIKSGEKLVIIKSGRHWPKLKELLKINNRLDKAIYVERVGQSEQKIIPAAEIETAAYFALIIVP